MKNKVVAVGDIHGHYKELMYVMHCLQESQYNIDFKKDVFVFLGDYIDGGPDTKQVLDALIKWKKLYPHWHFLYGNHEDLFFDAMNPNHPTYGDYYLWWNQGGRETTASYVRTFDAEDYQKAMIRPQDVIPKEHFEFMHGLEPYYEDSKYFYVHGGILPEHTIEWNKKHMKLYDMIWMREPFLNSEYDWKKKIIFGHTIQVKPYGNDFLKPFVMLNKIGLDTFAHNQGQLTAIILPNEILIQSEYTSHATSYLEQSL